MVPDNGNPLERTDDMSSLSPAERAKIYKERAAAAGLGPGAAAAGNSNTPAPTPPAPKPATPPAASAAPTDDGAGTPPSAPAPSAAPGGDPLGKTADMASLSPAERAKIYKERAAAAGIGRAPAAQNGDATPAAKPAAPAPVPAAAAAAGEKGGGAGALTPEQRQRLAAAVQRGAGGGGAGSGAATAAAPARAAAAMTPNPAEAQSQRLVYVWPHLVTIEFMASVLFLALMIFISVVIQAPLAGHANADKTPNPAKAPWYFLNLQELLLHMHPALAGVLVPSVALVLIAAIPYIDRDTRDVGKWFGTPKALRIIWHTSWFSTLVLIAEVLLDEQALGGGIKPFFQKFLGGALYFPVVVDIIVPLILMLGPIPLLVLLLNRVAKPEGARDWMLALFTGFFVAYIVLTIVGTFFRGQGMQLMWPWDPKMIVVE